MGAGQWWEQVCVRSSHLYVHVHVCVCVCVCTHRYMHSVGAGMCDIFNVYMHVCVCVCVCACAHSYSHMWKSLKKQCRFFRRKYVGCLSFVSDISITYLLHVCTWNTFCACVSLYIGWIYVYI